MYPVELKGLGPPNIRLIIISAAYANKDTTDQLKQILYLLVVVAVSLE
jgi:hypothetical protein